MGGRALAVIIWLGVTSAVASAQRIDFPLPDWCTYRIDLRVTTIDVTVTTDLDEVDVDGVPLRPRYGFTESREFVGSIDLIKYLGDKTPIEVVGDVELRALARGRLGMIAARAICRLDRTVLEVIDQRLRTAVARPNPWAAPYRGRGRKVPVVLVPIGQPGFDGGLAIADEDWLAPWRLRDLELIATETQTTRPLGRCSDCILDVPGGGGDHYPCRRQQRTSIVHVYEARTGRLIRKKSFTGDEPRSCLGLEGAPISFTEASGPSVPRQRIFDWIREAL